jgi:DNA repair photolyase
VGIGGSNFFLEFNKPRILSSQKVRVAATIPPVPIPLPIHGRGASENPPNRFEPIVLEQEEDFIDDSDGTVATQYFHDSTRTIIAHNDSPDVGFEFSINPYRGCEHGCIYCYARPTHEYLSLSSGIDFESKIFVKLNAPQLLRAELMKKSWQPRVISISGVTDCYQPAEKRFQLTRKCLEVLYEFRNPATVITKSHLVTRDIDLLSQMAKENLTLAILSITTLDSDLSAKMEPRAASPARRLDALRQLSRAGVSCGVMVAPVVPGLTDHEIPQILQAAADHGASFAGYVPLRLPFAIKDMFQTWLEQHYPDRKNKVLSRVRELRGGKLNDSNFISRMRGEGVWAEQLKTIFDLAKRKAGLVGKDSDLRTDLFRRPGEQMRLFV